jgi:hypothetical protein
VYSNLTVEIPKRLREFEEIEISSKAVQVTVNNTEVQLRQRIQPQEKGGKPDRKPYPFPYGSRNPTETETSSLRTLKIMPQKP